MGRPPHEDRPGALQRQQGEETDQPGELQRQRGKETGQPGELQRRRGEETGQSGELLKRWVWKVYWRKSRPGEQDWDEQTGLTRMQTTVSQRRRQVRLPRSVEVPKNRQGFSCQ